MKNSILAIIIFLSIFPLTATAQTDTLLKASVVSDTIKSEPSRASALNIFLDCMMCDRTYLKEVMPYINWVNDRTQADVHVIMTYRTTGSGGSENMASFTGIGKYKGLNDTLTYFNPPASTRDYTRKGQANMLAMGLMRYVARTPYAINMAIGYTEPNGKSKKVSQVVEDDPWNSWVFRVSSKGSYSKNETYEDLSIEGSISADRITEEWKSENDFRFENSRQNITSNGATSVYKDASWSLTTQQVKSLGPNFSAGGGAGASNSQQTNKKLSLVLEPAVEYDIYPYAESFKRQIRIKYSIPLELVDYYDETLFFEIVGSDTVFITEEFIARQKISMAIGFNQPWGNASFSVTSSHIIKDIQAYSLNITGDINWRIYKGLSVNMNARGGITKDQRWMPKKGLTYEETLLRLKRTNSKYSYSMSFGFTYTFGSMYNNVVNPRFGGGGGGGGGR